MSGELPVTQGIQAEAEGVREEMPTKGGRLSGERELRKHREKGERPGNEQQMLLGTSVLSELSGLSSPCPQNRVGGNSAHLMKSWSEDQIRSCEGEEFSKRYAECKRKLPWYPFVKPGAIRASAPELPVSRARHTDARASSDLILRPAEGGHLHPELGSGPGSVPNLGTREREVGCPLLLWWRRRAT